METATGLRFADAPIRPADEGSFSACWKRRVDWRHPRLAGTTFPQDDGKAKLALHSSLRRGWFFGSEKFREKLLRMLAKRLARMEKANGYHGPQFNDYAEDGRAASWGRGSNILGRIWQRCGGHAREIGAKGFWRP